MFSKVMYFQLLVWSIAVLEKLMLEKLNLQVMLDIKRLIALLYILISWIIGVFLGYVTVYEVGK